MIDGKAIQSFADWCRKTYTVSDKNAFEVTKASNSEKTEAKKLLQRMKKDTPNYLDICQYFLGDKGYDSGSLIRQLESSGIKPIIDILIRKQSIYIRSVK